VSLIVIIINQSSMSTDKPSRNPGTAGFQGLCHLIESCGFPKGNIDTITTSSHVICFACF
jgi:hypothetical protein